MVHCETVLRTYRMHNYVLYTSIFSMLTVNLFGLYVMYCNVATNMEVHTNYLYSQPVIRSSAR